MTNTKHTPGPWVLGANGMHVIGDNPSHLLADLNVAEGYETQRANAKHIVRCVNAHDELVAALRLIVAEQVPVGDGAYVSVERSIINRARAALAKVEG